MIGTYARIAAVALLAYAVVGLVVLGWGLAPIFYHAGVGLLFAFVGFWHSVNDETTRWMVGGLGVILVAVKVPMIVAPLLLWGGHLQHGPVEITCLVVGIASILAARYLPDGIRGRAEEPHEETLLVRRGDASAAGDRDQDPNDERQQE